MTDRPTTATHCLVREFGPQYADPLLLAKYAQTVGNRRSPGTPASRHSAASTLPALSVSKSMRTRPDGPHAMPTLAPSGQCPQATPTPAAMRSGSAQASCSQP